MVDSIKDGTGKGYLVEVTNENMLLTQSVSVPFEHHVNHKHSKSFSLICNQTPTAAADYFIYIKNANGDDMMIFGFDFSVGTNEGFEVIADVDGTPSGTTATPVNKNIGSGLDAEGTFVVGNDITGLSGGTLIRRFIKQGNNESKCFEIVSGIIVPKNHNIAIRAITGGIQVYANICFDYHSED